MAAVGLPGAFVQAALGTTVLLLIGRAAGVGMRPNIPMLALVVMLTVLCLCGFGVVIAARARSFTEGSLLTDALGAGLVFLAPVYYMPESMPHGLRFVSRLLPTAFAASAVRTTLMGGHQIGSELLALSLMAIVTLAVHDCGTSSHAASIRSRTPATVVRSSNPASSSVAPTSTVPSCQGTI